MAGKQAEQDDGRRNEEDTVAALRDDLRRFREQGDGPARHQQQKGGLAEHCGEDGGAWPNAGDQDAGARGAPIVMASTRSIAPASKMVETS